jgi:RNA polymerase sigma-70 factor (sigma-E family)
VTAGEQGDDVSDDEVPPERAERAGRRAGFESDFTAFVEGHQRRLRGVAYLVCGDWHRAEDAVQTALANVYARWPRIEADPGPWAYARRAVVNAAIDEGRRPWRRREAVGHPAPPEVAALPGSLDDATLAALSALPKRQRAVVVLRYIEDLDVESTAALLGISPGTVRSQATRGLASMREHMGIGADQEAGR